MDLPSPGRVSGAVVLGSFILQFLAAFPTEPCAVAAGLLARELPGIQAEAARLANKATHCFGRAVEYEALVAKLAVVVVAPG